MQKRVNLTFIVLGFLLLALLPIYPVKVWSTNPETNEITEEIYRVSLYNELEYENKQYEHFNISKTVLLKPFSVYRQQYTPKKYIIVYQDGNRNILQNYNYGEVVKLQKQLEQLHPYENPMGYKDEYGNLYIKSFIKPTGSKVLYSQWQGKTYNIYYDGELKGTYRYGEGSQLTTPKKSGYVFDGWYLDGKKVKEIDTEMYGDVKLVSKWSKIVYYHNASYWVVNYKYFGDHSQYAQMVRTLNSGYAVYFDAYIGNNIILGHNPGIFSWIPRAQVGQKVLVNGQMYTITKKYITTIQEYGESIWQVPADMGLLTCYNGTRNRMILLLTKN